MAQTQPATLDASLYDEPLPPRDARRQAISEHFLADERLLLSRLLEQGTLPAETSARVVQQAAAWVCKVRQGKNEQSALDAFLREYDLSSEEGVLLMCLAEALLRVPDDDTAERLIADKLSDAEWNRHLGHSDSLLVNASTWGLLLTGRIVRLSTAGGGGLRAAWAQLLGRSTEPVIRLAVRSAMRLMGSQFVMGRGIGEALRRSHEGVHRDCRHSFDMLGEAALTAADAERYFHAYRNAIEAIGAQAGPADPADHGAVHARPGISVKLSALHPRYEAAQRRRVLAELTPRLQMLAQAARTCAIGLTVDAEEADRLELSLNVFERVCRDPSIAGWHGLGLAVQAVQKRALPLIDWLAALAADTGRHLPVRLVKGAYWDTEVKRAQEQGLAGYPVFTRKCNTDVSYLACARRLLDGRRWFFPQIATHNAHTLAAVLAYAHEGAGCTGFEFQRLHGMGESLHAVVHADTGVPCRVYAPVGSHEDLLPYLVRRLLENGANTSFVHRIFDEAMPAEELVADPAQKARVMADAAPALPLPPDLYGEGRRNAAGLHLADEPAVAALDRALSAARQHAHPGQCWRSITAVAGGADEVCAVLNPADRRQVVGRWQELSPGCAAAVIECACAGQPAWSSQPVSERGACLLRAADLLEQRRAAFLHLLIAEAGKTIADALAEVRETVDFLRYYAQQAQQLLQSPLELPGPTGEHNELQLHARGAFVCISPWNFPLAIFTGQLAAALACGNAVIAKPAEQTALIAVQMTRLLHEAGIPPDVLQCVLGAGELGAALVADPRIAGVVFTGSVAVAQSINRTLAARTGPIIPLVAETGGLNAMIVDSTALPEQVVKDVIHSAFHSAGQRCSALRLLCLQDVIAGRTLTLLGGAMRELRIGDPARLSTDIGPVIEPEAAVRLEQHAEAILRDGDLIERLPMPADCAHGSYFAPLAVEIAAPDRLTEEHFGPFLHVVRYPARGLDSLVDAINRSGYGLTLGVHSRIESTWRRVQSRARVGNVYVNRGMTGAVVGVQPFGGEGLSGTGPKAGGPHYLLRFLTERTLSINTAAVGGNARLFAGAG